WRGNSLAWQRKAFRCNSPFHRLRRRQGRLEDVRISPTAAEVALDADLKFFERGAGVFHEEPGDRGDEAIGAEAAHHAVFFAECRLDRRELFRRADAFDGGDLLA